MEGKQYKDFHDLDIWKDGYKLLMLIYKITEKIPEWERYSIISQIVRSANSVIANIAESHGRYTFNDKIRVLYIVRGEIMETRSHLSVVYGCKYITEFEFKDINKGYKKLNNNLNKYIFSLKNNLKS